jgi:Na+/proline symporter
MEDTNDTGIPIWVTFLFTLFIFRFTRQNHNVSMCAGVHGVLSTSHIVCSVIDSKNFVPVYAIVDDRDATSFFIREIVVFSFKLLTKDLSEKVVFKPGNKVLGLHGFR